MATKQNTSAKQTPANDPYSQLKALFLWRDNVESDLLALSCRELCENDEMFLHRIIATLEESPLFEEMAKGFPMSVKFELMVTCARMYLAGKCSARRYDDAAPQLVAAGKPSNPSPTARSKAAA